MCPHSHRLSTYAQVLCICGQGTRTPWRRRPAGDSTRSSRYAVGAVPRDHPLPEPDRRRPGLGSLNQDDPVLGEPGAAASRASPGRPLASLHQPGPGGDGLHQDHGRGPGLHRSGPETEVAGPARALLLRRAGPVLGPAHRQLEVPGHAGLRAGCRAAGPPGPGAGQWLDRTGEASVDQTAGLLVWSGTALAGKVSPVRRKARPRRPVASGTNTGEDWARPTRG